MRGKLVLFEEEVCIRFSLSIKSPKRNGVGWNPGLLSLSQGAAVRVNKEGIVTN